MKNSYLFFLNRQLSGARILADGKSAAFILNKNPAPKPKLSPRKEAGTYPVKSVTYSEYFLLYWIDLVGKKLNHLWSAQCVSPKLKLSPEKRKVQ